MFYLLVSLLSSDPHSEPNGEAVTHLPLSTCYTDIASKNTDFRSKSSPSLLRSGSTYAGTQLELHESSRPRITSTNARPTEEARNREKSFRSVHKSARLGSREMPQSPARRNGIFGRRRGSGGLTLNRGKYCDQGNNFDHPQLLLSRGGDRGGKRWSRAFEAPLVPAEHEVAKIQ